MLGRRRKMRRTLSEMLAYVFAVMFGGACVWALGTDRCAASIAAMIVTCALCVWFTICAIGETIDAIRNGKRARR